MRDHVFLAAGVFDMSFQQSQVKEISDAQPPPSHFVFVGRPNAAGSGANLHPSGRVLRGQLNHSVIGQDHLSAVAHEKIAVHLHAVFAKRGNFLEKSHGVEHDAVADHTTAARTQYAARNQLQDEFLAFDDDSVAGIVATSIAGHDAKVVGENVDNLALAFVAPLRAD